MTNFGSEADMLLPLTKHPSCFGVEDTSSVETFFEVPSSNGIPDLVFAAFDPAVVDRRRTAALSPLTRSVEIRVVDALSRLAQSAPDAVMSMESLQNLTRASVSHLSRDILPRLAEIGYIERLGRQGWRSLRKLEIAVREVACVEAKLRIEKRGLWQATRQPIANSWLVIGSRVRSQTLDKYARCGVGLAVLESDGSLRVATAPRRRSISRFEYLAFAERLFEMRESGVRSGPIPLVFGAKRTVTSGVDPRVPIGAAR